MWCNKMSCSSSKVPSSDLFFDINDQAKQAGMQYNASIALTGILQRELDNRTEKAREAEKAAKAAIAAAKSALEEVTSVHIALKLMEATVKSSKDVAERSKEYLANKSSDNACTLAAAINVRDAVNKDLFNAIESAHFSISNFLK